MSALNYTIYTLELTKNLLSFTLNFLVLYITVRKFKLKGVDICISFILCTIDILFCLHNSIHIILHATTNSKINQDPMYNKIYFRIYSVLTGISFNCLVVLGVVRYMAICKSYLISRRSGVLLVLACSLVPVLLCIVMSVIATGRDASNKLQNIYPTLNFKDNYITKPMALFVNFSTIIYLGILAFCYFNISLYYYKSLGLLELQTYSSAKSRNLRGYNNNNNNSKNTKTTKFRSNDDSDVLESYNATKKFIKSQQLITCLKYSLIILVFICETLPVGIIYTIFYFYQTPIHAIWNITCIYIFHCFTITNPCIILFLHLETFQEFKNLVKRIGAKFKK
jgi:hypothetical protein